jgi:hypothetical protein
MKKLFLLGLALLLFVACQDKPERFTTTSLNIDVVKKLVADYHNGDWEAWRTNYSDSAKLYHNTWKNSATPEDIRDALKGLLANTSKYHFDESEDMIFYEQIIDNEDKTWVNFWGNWQGTLAANGQELQIPVHLSCLMKDGKIAAEYGFYNLGEINAALKAIAKAEAEAAEESEATE